MNDIIVIGAGASGMMAALKASELGKRVLLIEKMEQPGRKLRITGKGRCNLTNTAPLKEFITHIGSDGRFVRNCFSRFFNQELMDFFEQHGVPLVVERGSRVFPSSGKSLDIFLAIINALEKNPLVTIKKNISVTKLFVAEGKVTGVRLSDGSCESARKVILCTGGRSYPSTGSTGDGYQLAESVGHTIVPCVPSLVALTCQEPIPEELIGFQLKNVSLTVMLENGKPLGNFFGEMTFTNDGITGPIVLSASRIASRPIAENQKLLVRIDLKPALEPDKLDKKIINDLDSNGNRLFHDALRLWLPAELIPLALERLKIEKFKRLNQINGAERKKLLMFLKGVTFTLTGTHGWDEAIVTQGGINLKEVNPKTMESKLVDGLYFAGEVLDLDADTGGYNLQIAFSTAYSAAHFACGVEPEK